MSQLSCYNCGRSFSALGKHFAHPSGCDFPEFDEQQEEVLTGLLMGDGWIQETGQANNPHLSVQMVSPNYLSYLHTEVFPEHGRCEPYLKATGEELAERYSMDPDNTQDAYYWATVSTPKLHSWQAWYDSGKKVWPSDISLTPTVLKHWYAGDGTIEHTQGGSITISISMNNERGNEEKVEQYFQQADIPSPDRWNAYQTDEGFWNNEAVWNNESSHQLLDYMGTPLPDFEYKWATP